jgi:hypothetical protein
MLSWTELQLLYMYTYVSQDGNIIAPGHSSLVLVFELLKKKKKKKEISGSVQIFQPGVNHVVAPLQLGWLPSQTFPNCQDKCKQTMRMKKKKNLVRKVARGAAWLGSSVFSVN